MSFSALSLLVISIEILNILSLIIVSIEIVSLKTTKISKGHFDNSLCASMSLYCKLI